MGVSSSYIALNTTGGAIAWSDNEYAGKMNHRILFETDHYQSGLTGDYQYVRLTFQPNSGLGHDFYVTKVSISKLDSRSIAPVYDNPAYDFLWNGSLTFLAAGGGNPIVSDWLPFEFIASKDHYIHVAMVTSDTSYWVYNSTNYAAFGTPYWKYGTNDESHLSNITGYTTAANPVIVARIEVATRSDIHAFKLQATATPGKAGPVTAVVRCAVPGGTVYIDPIIIES